MRITVSVPDKNVVIDGEGRVCPDLVAPDDWAKAYQWDNEVGGRIEPIQRPDVPFHEVEWFLDGNRMNYFIAQWYANEPPPEVTPHRPRKRKAAPDGV